jgi:hypothetical protein
MMIKQNVVREDLTYCSYCSQKAVYFKDNVAMCRNCWEKNMKSSSLKSASFEDRIKHVG